MINRNCDSWAILGVEIDKKCLYDYTYERSCDCEIEYDEHNLPNFCSNCGIKFAKEEGTPIPNYEHSPNGDHLRGYDLFFAQHDKVYVCLLKVRVSGKHGINSKFENIFRPHFNDRITAFLNNLKEIGIGVDMNMFGLYVFQRHEPIDNHG